MRVVIHAGMHKTGSSAIQQAFSQRQAPDFHYLDWYSSNHCELFVYLFQEMHEILNYHSVRARGPEFQARIPAIRAEWNERLTSQLDACRDKTVLLSAEDISFPTMAAATARMRDFFARWTSDIRVIAYVRSPTSFAQSAFQQLLKEGGTARLDPAVLWPHYRARFAHFDTIFGRENVTLRSYDDLADRDVGIVEDFGRWIGMETAGQPEVRVNETLSAEAIALLYLQRRFGDGFVSGSPQALQGNDTFIGMLGRIGEKKLAFDPALWAALDFDMAGDLAWIEERMQMRLKDRPGRNTAVIASEADLVELGLNNLVRAQDLLSARLAEMPCQPVEKLVRLLDLLRKACY
jgi:hypothetical protein